MEEHGIIEEREEIKAETALLLEGIRLGLGLEDLQRQRAALLRRCRRLMFKIAAGCIDVYEKDPAALEDAMAKEGEPPAGLDVEQRALEMLREIGPFGRFGDDPSEILRAVQVGMTVEEYLAQPVPKATGRPVAPKMTRAQAWAWVACWAALEAERPDLAAEVKAETDPHGVLTADELLAAHIAPIADFGDDPAAVIRDVRAGRALAEYLADPIRMPGLPASGPDKGQDGKDGPEGQAGGDRGP
jgi:hypothetical protein